MGFFNEKQIKAITTGIYPCIHCNTPMIWEDEWEDILICPKCGYSVETERYGFTDEEYEDLFPTEDECSDEDDDSEPYDNIYGELDD